MMNTRRSLQWLLFLAVFSRNAIKMAEAAVACDSDAYCEQMIRPGSVCDNEGFCTNPFSQGCLRRMLGEEEAAARNFNVRRCNSDDPPDAEELGLCSGSYFNYTEVRVHNSNWESSIFFSWIIQILLSELVEVPVTIGLGPDTAEASFYHPGNTFPYSAKAYPFDALAEANRVGGDCRQSDNECAHVLPEVWNGQEAAWNDALEAGTVLPVEGNGMVGRFGYYIPNFTADEDNTLVSYHGIRGPHNRQKLAKTFLRPTTWYDYCREESPTNCTSFDGVTDRWPTEDEFDTYYADGVYSGYFRETEENNCEANNQTCTGHIVGPPCTWSTNLEAQMYHNDIALASSGPLTPNGGYSYGQMIQIWNAAHETKSHVAMWWWAPDSLIEQFRESRSAFQLILLPEATQDCYKARISPDDRCSDDVWARRGDAAGACDYEPHALQKVVASSLQTITNADPAVTRSPGYQMVKNIKVTDLALNDMMKHWIFIGVDKYGYDPREAVCSWVADNIDSLETLVPNGYPRVLDDTSPYDFAGLYVMQGVGALSVLVVLATAGAVVHYRKKRVFVYAQFHFLMPMLLGFFLYGLASMVVVLEPSTASCMSTQWLILVGLTMQLVPLLIKIAAINRVLQSAKKMRRVKISPSHMFYAVMFLVLLVIIYLSVWTAVDPLKRAETLFLPEEDGNVIERSIECVAGSHVWILVGLVWEIFLLVCTAVLAFQSRNVNQEFNESKILGRTVYAHTLFMLARLVVEFLQDQWQPNVVAAIVSLLISAETLCTLGIYFVPKFFELKFNRYARDKRDSSVFASSYVGRQSFDESGRSSDGVGRGSLASNRGSVRCSNEIANIEAAAAAAAAAYRESQASSFFDTSDDEAPTGRTQSTSLNDSADELKQGRDRGSIKSATSEEEEQAGAPSTIAPQPVGKAVGKNNNEQPEQPASFCTEQTTTSARDRKRLLEAAVSARQKAQSHKAAP